MPTARQRILVGLLAIVIVHKVAYFFEYAALPFLYGPIFDSSVYDAQAAAVRAGDFGNPTLLAFSPLYGYALAMLPSGAYIATVVLQQLLGLINILLVHRIALRCFGTREALAAASLYFGYALFSFYETKILSETLGLTLALLGMHALLSAEVRIHASVRWTALAGALTAFAVLARASMLFAGCASVLAAYFPWATPREEFRVLVRRGSVFALGFALVLAANGTWNFVNTGHFVPVIFASHTAARASDTRDWSGSLASFSTRPDGEVSPWDVVDQARARLRGEDAHANSSTLSDLQLGNLMAGAPSKLARTFSDTETTFDYGFYGERSEVNALRLLPLSFGCILLLALVGAYALARSKGLRMLVPFLPFIFGTVATTVVFHPSSRYRLPMLLPLVLLAGFGAVAVWNIEKVRVRNTVVSLLLAVSVILAVRHELHALRSPAWWHLRVAESASSCGDLMTVEQRVRRARELAPNDEALNRRLDRLSRRSR